MQHLPAPGERQPVTDTRVKAAILLVADGHYPEVVVANLPDAISIVDALTPEARRLAVELSLLPGSSGGDIRVSRR